MRSQPTCRLAGCVTAAFLSVSPSPHHWILGYLVVFPTSDSGPARLASGNRHSPVAEDLAASESGRVAERPTAPK